MPELSIFEGTILVHSDSERKGGGNFVKSKIYDSVKGKA